MTQYILNYTDSTKTPFVVKPYTINGLAAPTTQVPYNNIDAGIIAVSADTSLVFYGKGLPAYGEILQQNQLYMLENFASPTRPLNPVEGQLWFKNADYVDPNPLYSTDPTLKGMYVWTGTAWDPLVVSSGAAAPLDMGGFEIQNVGAPTTPNSAVTVSYADSNYLMLSGGTVTGPTAFTNTVDIQGNIQWTALPTIPQHLTNKDYVDTLASGKVDKTGDTITGNLDIQGSLVVGADLELSGALTVVGTGADHDIGGRKLTNVGYPTATADGATKGYVDAAIVASGSDGVVTSGSLDTGTGTLTLVRSAPLAPVIVSGAFAHVGHTQDSSTVTHQTTNDTYVALHTVSSTVGVDDVIGFLGQDLLPVAQRSRRQLIDITVPTTIVSLASAMGYVVGDNKLDVYFNGVKQYASERGTSAIVCEAPSLTLLYDTGLSSGTYTFDITVDANPTQTISVSTVEPTTYGDLVVLINTQLSTLSVGAVLSTYVLTDTITYIFESDTSGAGSSVTVSFAPGELFTSIISSTVTAPVNIPVVVDRAYEETGTVGNISTTLTFTSAINAGTLEVIARG